MRQLRILPSSSMWVRANDPSLIDRVFNWIFGVGNW
jgi:hypothetical protein